MKLPMKRIGGTVGALMLAAGASSVHAYSLPGSWQITYTDFEFFNADLSTVTGTPGTTTIEANTIEDGQGIFRISDIQDRANGNAVVWGDGDLGQHLYGLFWGFDTQGILEQNSIGLVGPGTTDSLVLDQVDATHFFDVGTGTSTTAIPDLDGDGLPDAGMAIFLHTGADTFGAARDSGPAARDVSAAALADGIPNFAGITCLTVCDGSDDYALQALFQFPIGERGVALGDLGGGLGLPLPHSVARVNLTAPFPTVNTGVLDSHLDLLNSDLSGSYDGTVPYSTPFDNVVLDAQPTNIPGVFADADLKFNVRQHPDPGQTDFGWTLNSQDPVIGNAVPEPSSIALLGIGLLGLGAAVRRRRNNA